jgi:RecA-family ATPase
MTVDVGPAATNKSMLMLTDAVAIVTGRSILDDIAHEQGEVLLFAGEDARRDVEARLAGILQHHEIEPAELAGRLHVVYLAEIDPLKYSLAQMRDDMATLNGQMLDWLRDRPGILAILLDPIAAWHRLIENDNVAMQLLCTTLRAVAVQGRRHVGFNHHVNKAAMTDVEAHVGNLAALRGATAIVNSVRWTFTLARLSEKTAEEYGIAEDERRHYRRLDSGKASYGPDDDDTRLLRVVSVSIANGEEIGVLVEVDTTQARKRGEERETTEGQKQRERLAAALTRMLREKRPRSTRATGRWLVVYEPQMFVGASGKCLSEESIRRKLLAMIGDGLPVPHEPTQRIVVRLAEKRGESDEVDFKQADLPLAEVEQPRNRDTMKSG